jgi:membrane-bound ClpP family serine protease
MTPWPAQHGTNPPSHRVARAAIVILGILFCRASVSAGAENDPQGIERLGMLIRVDLPITGRVASRVQHFVDQALEKARREQKQAVLIFEFRVAEGQEKFAGRTKFSDALKLARLLRSVRLGWAHTVAYVPEKLPGHAVLVAMACDDIAMPGDAQFGPVGPQPEPIGETERSEYTKIAGGRRTRIPAEVALWLLDPSRKVLKVETLKEGRQYVTREELERLRDRLTITSEEELRALVDQPGQLSGDEARELEFVSYKPDTRQDVAKWLKLPPEAMVEDLSLVQQWQAVQVSLQGEIQSGMVTQTIRLIEDQTRLGEKNFVCVWIDSEGGSLTESLRLADFLANGLDPGKIRTVAYVPKQARADAALIALACDQVVMHPQAELGGPSDYVLSEEEIEIVRELRADEDSPWKSRSWSLVNAMVDPELTVFRCTRPGETGYFCDDELKQLEQERPGEKKWQKGVQVTIPGEPFHTDGTDAVEKYRLANFTAESLDEFRQQYDLEELTVLEPGWVDHLILALASPGLSFLLLAIAFLAVYAELHAPGIGIGGFVATVCFLLFFWSHYLDKTATELEILLFVAGIACLLLEIFVLPGFGIFGLGGGCLMLVSLILASQTSVLPQSSDKLWDALWPVALAMGVVVVAAVLLQYWFPRAPILREMVLEPPAGEEAEDISRRESLVDLDDFVGARGTATTQLTPGGKARFEDMLLDVITDGEVVQRGSPIEVVEVQGNRVIVRALEKG